MLLLPPHYHQAAAAAVATASATAAATATTATAFIFLLSLSLSPMTLCCQHTSGNAAALPPTWLWQQINYPFLWHGEAAKNWKDDRMAMKFGGCGEMGQVDGY
jgi:hypothetical protein